MYDSMLWKRGEVKWIMKNI